MPYRRILDHELNEYFSDNHNTLREFDIIEELEILAILECKYFDEMITLIKYVENPEELIHNCKIYLINKYKTTIENINYFHNHNIDAIALYTINKLSELNKLESSIK